MGKELNLEPDVTSEMTISTGKRSVVLLGCVRGSNVSDSVDVTGLSIWLLEKLARVQSFP